MPAFHALSQRLSISYGELHEELLRALIRRGAAPDEAEDLVSASIAKLLSMPVEQIEAIENVRAYLHAIARNLLTETAKEASRVRPTPDSDLDRGVLESGYGRIESQQSRQLVVRAFERLPERPRRILWLSVIEELSSREIAERLGMSTTNVSTQSHRARTALRTAYVAEFIALTPPACGTDPGWIAKVVTETASARDTQKFAAHASRCEFCPDVAEAARNEASWLPSLVPLVALGGVAGGMHSAFPDTPAAATAAGYLRATLGAASVLAGAAMLLTWVEATELHLPWSDDAGAHIIASGSGPTPTSTPERVSLSVAPERISLPMPAPGHMAEWSAHATSDSSDSAQLLAAVTVTDASYDTQPASISFSIDTSHPGGPTHHTEPIPVSDAAETHYLYLGPVLPGEMVATAGTVLRDPADTDQTANAHAEISFVLVDHVPSDTRIGDEVGVVPSPNELPATGSPSAAGAPIWAWLGGGGLLLTGGALFVRRSTQRRA